MAAPDFSDCLDDGHHYDDTLFAAIARDLLEQGYSIRVAALPPALSAGLQEVCCALPEQSFDPAGVGRRQAYLHSEWVRSDSIHWIQGHSEATRQWLDWTARLRVFLNRRLFLGLFSFESHFAHYQPGDFYRRHYDAFRGEANRVLSLVTYLNHGWLPQEGGELLLYRNDEDAEGIRVLPLYGTLVIFLSEQFPHEVLPARRDRYSVAGWYRVNTSTTSRADPPR